MIKKKEKTPKWMDTTLTISFIFYIWYFGSTLLLPLTDFLHLPKGVLITLYNLSEFPPSILGFIFCVSLISTIVILSEFKEEKTLTKLFLIEGLTLLLYFIIPILATIALLVLIITGITAGIPNEARISYFIEDLFLFTASLFALTAILNIVMHKLIEVATKEKPVDLRPNPQKHSNEFYKRSVKHE